MAIVKKGSRIITVDEVVYRWRVRGRPTDAQGLARSPLAYAVEQDGAAGAVLVVTTDQPHPGNWFGLPGRAVLPADVATAIRAARAEGWAPEKPGPTFPLDRSKGFAPAH